MSNNELPIFNCLEDEDLWFRTISSITRGRIFLRRAMTGKEYIEKFSTDTLAIGEIVDLNVQDPNDNDDENYNPKSDSNSDEEEIERQKAFGATLALKKAQLLKELGIPVPRVILVSA